MDDRSLYPVGYIQYYADSSGVIRLRQMETSGWRYLDSGKIELAPSAMPAHSHYSVPNPSPHVHSYDPVSLATRQGYFAGSQLDGRWVPRTIQKQQRPNRSDVIGTVENVVEDSRGLKVTMKLNDFFTKEVERATIATDDLHKLFPDVTAPRSGLKLTTTPIKENDMTGTTQLKTPTEDIQRKDLTVAMRLLGTKDQDYLLHALALVQELKEGQTLYRAHELAKADVVGDTVEVDGSKTKGYLSDVKNTDPGYQHATVRLVVDGKLVDVEGMAYVIVTPAPELGDDTLRVVKD